MSDIDVRIERDLDEINVPSPPMNRIIERGIAMRRRRLIAQWSAAALGVTLVAGISLAGPTLLDRAERNVRPLAPITREESVNIFAIEVISEAGLRGVTRFFDFIESTHTAAGWNVTFNITECTTRAGSACDHLGSAQLIVEDRSDELVVVDLQGDATEAEAHRVVGVRGSPPELRDVGRYNLVRFHPTRHDPDSLTMTFVWQGEIPARSNETCVLRVFSAPGEVLFESRPLPQSHPQVEGARDGLFSAEVPDHVRNPSGARMVCSE